MDSKSIVRKDLRVRVPPRAPNSRLVGGWASSTVREGAGRPRGASALRRGLPVSARGRRGPTATPRPGCSRRWLDADRACPAAHRRALAPRVRGRRRTTRRAKPSLRAPGRDCHERTPPSIRRVKRQPELLVEPRPCPRSLPSGHPGPASTCVAPTALTRLSEFSHESLVTNDLRREDQEAAC